MTPEEQAQRAKATAAAVREQERIDAACFRLMTDPELAPLRLWWEAETLRAVLPPGPVDALRLAMNQGDRERYLMVMTRAERRRAAMAKGE
jgi:hypothetical protein